MPSEFCGAMMPETEQAADMLLDLQSLAPRLVTEAFARVDTYGEGLVCVDKLGTVFCEMLGTKSSELPPGSLHNCLKEAGHNKLRGDGWQASINLDELEKLAAHTRSKRAHRFLTALFNKFSARFAATFAKPTGSTASSRKIDSPAGSMLREHFKEACFLTACVAGEEVPEEIHECVLFNLLPGDSEFITLACFRKYLANEPRSLRRETELRSVVRCRDCFAYFAAYTAKHSSGKPITAAFQTGLEYLSRPETTWDECHTVLHDIFTAYFRCCFVPEELKGAAKDGEAIGCLDKTDHMSLGGIGDHDDPAGVVQFSDFERFFYDPDEEGGKYSEIHWGHRKTAHPTRKTTPACVVGPSRETADLSEGKALVCQIGGIYNMRLQKNERAYFEMKIIPQFAAKAPITVTCCPVPEDKFVDPAPTVFRNVPCTKLNNESITNITERNAKTEPVRMFVSRVHRRPDAKDHEWLCSPAAGGVESLRYCTVTIPTPQEGGIVYVGVEGVSGEPTTFEMRTSLGVGFDVFENPFVLNPPLSQPRPDTSDVATQRPMPNNFPGANAAVSGPIKNLKQQNMPLSCDATDLVYAFSAPADVSNNRCGGFNGKTTTYQEECWLKRATRTGGYEGTWDHKGGATSQSLTHQTQISRPGIPDSTMSWNGDVRSLADTGNWKGNKDWDHHQYFKSQARCNQ